MNKYKVNLSKEDKKSGKINQINSVDDWKKYAPPMKDEHWKNGKSAKELAKYIIGENDYLPQELEVLLIKIGCKQELELEGEPEKITGLKSRGNGRTHDLLLVKEEEVVLGVEAKVAESFGSELVCKIINDYKNDPQKMEGKYKRLNYLYKCIYGSKIDNISKKDSEHLRYQLLTATVGTLLEAEKAKAKKAALVIITFVSVAGSVSNGMKKNEDDLYYFISTISEYRQSGGSYKLPGFENIEFYIEHLNI